MTLDGLIGIVTLYPAQLVPNCVRNFSNTARNGIPPIVVNSSAREPR